MMAVHCRWPRSHSNGRAAVVIPPHHHRLDARYLKAPWHPHHQLPGLDLPSPPCPPQDHLLNSSLSPESRFIASRDQLPSPWHPKATSPGNSSASLGGDDAGSPLAIKGGDINCNIIQQDKLRDLERLEGAGGGHVASQTVDPLRKRMTSNGLQDSRADVSGTPSNNNTSPTSSGWRPASQVSPPSSSSARPSHRLTPNSTNSRVPSGHLTHEHLMLQGVGPSAGSLFRPSLPGQPSSADSRHFPSSQLGLLYPSSSASSSSLYPQSLYMHPGQPSPQLTLGPYAPFPYGHASSSGYPPSTGGLLPGFAPDNYSSLLTTLGSRFGSLPRPPFHPGAVPPQYPLPVANSSPGPLPRLPTPSQPSSLPQSTSSSSSGPHHGLPDGHAARSPKHELNSVPRGPSGPAGGSKFAHRPSLMNHPYKMHLKEESRDKVAKELPQAFSAEDRFKKGHDTGPPSKRPRTHSSIGHPPPLTRTVPAGGLPPPPPLHSSTSDATPHYPPHFMKGSIIQLANGELKRVEELRTEDFVHSADVSSDLKIDSSTVVRIEENHERGTAVLGFSVGEHRVQVTVEATLEHPFFVFGQGWSSCNPQQTHHRYGLHCHKLTVGDVCISLTHKDIGATASKASAKAKQNSVRQTKSDSAATTRPQRSSSAGGTVSPKELKPCIRSSAPKRRWSAPDQLAAVSENGPSCRLKETATSSTSQADHLTSPASSGVSSSSPSVQQHQPPSQQQQASSSTPTTSRPMG